MNPLNFVWKLFLWSSLRKSYSICLENSDMAKFWPFKTKIWPFFGQNWLFWEFFTYNPNAAMNLLNFGYGTSLNFYSFRGTNHTVSCLGPTTRELSRIDQFRILWSHFSQRDFIKGNFVYIIWQYWFIAYMAFLTKKLTKFPQPGQFLNKFPDSRPSFSQIFVLG